MASDLLESYIQQFSHNTAEIVSTTTKIPTVYGSKNITAGYTQFLWKEFLCKVLLAKQQVLVRYNNRQTTFAYHDDGRSPEFFLTGSRLKILI